MQQRSAYKKGDIVLVNFPFTDFSGQKRRPALVVGFSEYHVVVVFITTKNTPPFSWRVSIPKGETTGLLLSSYLCCDKILSIDTAIVTAGIGQASQVVVNKVDAKLKQLLRL